jgi:hypothetical protein
MDNLESQTYDVFEKDPVKYELYQEAIEKALRGMRGLDRPVSVAVLVKFPSLLFVHFQINRRTLLNLSVHHRGQVEDRLLLVR